jgi:hypothetical protein
MMKAGGIAPSIRIAGWSHIRSIAFKSSREGNDPVSGHRSTERRHKLKSGLTFELCTGTESLHSLLGKGCLFHVEAEANASETFPSADGRVPGDAPTSLPGS